MHFAHCVRSVAATRLKFRNNVTRNLTYSNHAESLEIARLSILSPKIRDKNDAFLENRHISVSACFDRN